MAKKTKSSSRPASTRTKGATTKPRKAVTGPSRASSAKKTTGAKAPSSAKASKTAPAKKTAKAPKPAAGATPPAPVPVTSASAPQVALGHPGSNNGNDHGDFTALPIEQLRKVKSGLNAKDLAYFQQLLREKRVELVGDVKSMHEGARQASGGNLSHMPVHMADIGSDNYDQEFTLGMVESEAKLLREIDEALIRIREGYYGVCMVSGKPIARPRLEVKPWAKYSIDVAREMEKRGLL